MQHIVMFSGGIGSYLCAKRVVAEHGTADVTLLFADTRVEDEDLYRFLDEASARLACRLVKVSDGRTPWEVFKDAKFLGNSRVDLCSKALKRVPCNKWLKENCDPAQTLIYVGIGWTESHRYDKIKMHNKVWRYLAPMCSAPFLTDVQALAEVRADGIRPPRLYGEGFAHNNCGGFCVKAGQAHFANLLKKRPDTYRYNEQKEEELRSLLQKDVAVLLDRTNGKKVPMTMREFRRRLEAGEQYDLLEWGGCGCYAGV